MCVEYNHLLNHLLLKNIRNLNSKSSENNFNKTKIRNRNNNKSFRSKRRNVKKKPIKLIIILIAQLFI